MTSKRCEVRCSMFVSNCVWRLSHAECMGCACDLRRHEQSA